MSTQCRMIARCTSYTLLYPRVTHMKKIIKKNVVYLLCIKEICGGKRCLQPFHFTMYKLYNSSVIILGASCCVNVSPMPCCTFSPICSTRGPSSPYLLSEMIIKIIHCVFIFMAAREPQQKHPKSKRDGYKTRDHVYYGN